MLVYFINVSFRTAVAFRIVINHQAAGNISWCSASNRWGENGRISHVVSHHVLFSGVAQETRWSGTQGLIRGKQSLIIGLVPGTMLPQVGRWGEVCVGRFELARPFGSILSSSSLSCPRFKHHEVFYFMLWNWGRIWHNTSQYRLVFTYIYMLQKYLLYHLLLLSWNVGIRKRIKFCLEKLLNLWCREI